MISKIVLAIVLCGALQLELVQGFVSRSYIARQAAQQTPIPTPLRQRKKPQDQENERDRDGDNTFDDDSSNIDLIGATESSLDQSIAASMKQLLDAGPAEPELSRVEVFNNLYKDIKARKGEGKALSSEEMLKELFRDVPVIDPFDDVSAIDMSISV
jgi:hypothetical protein